MGCSEGPCNLCSPCLLRWTGMMLRQPRLLCRWAPAPGRMHAADVACGGQKRLARWRARAARVCCAAV